ncbi:MAG TPA: hypothetical protein VGR53_11285 [Nitrososphaerales archaeon]|nr:hypothetical protein [Nitrososphaerales archaeon]
MNSDLLAELDSSDFRYFDVDKRLVAKGDAGFQSFRANEMKI